MNQKGFAQLILVHGLVSSCYIVTIRDSRIAIYTTFLVTINSRTHLAIISDVYMNKKYMKALYVNVFCDMHFSVISIDLGKPGFKRMTQVLETSMISMHVE